MNDVNGNEVIVGSMVEIVAGFGNSLELKGFQGRVVGEVGIEVLVQLPKGTPHTHNGLSTTLKSGVKASSLGLDTLRYFGPSDIRLVKSQCEFKVGDLVEILEEHQGVPKGTITTILKVADGCFPVVEYSDGWYFGDGIKGWHVPEKYLSLVTSNILAPETCVKVNTEAQYLALMTWVEGNLEEVTDRIGFKYPRCYSMNQGLKCTCARDSFYEERGYRILDFSEINLLDSAKISELSYRPTKPFSLRDVSGTGPCDSEFDKVVCTATKDFNLTFNRTVNWTKEIEDCCVENGWISYLLDRGFIEKNEVEVEVVAAPYDQSKVYIFKSNVFDHQLQLMPGNPKAYFWADINNTNARWDSETHSTVEAAIKHVGSERVQEFNSMKEYIQSIS